MPDEATEAESDAALVTLATHGDASALLRLLRRHERWVFNLALYMLQVRADAQDATQEILLKVTTHLGSFRGSSTFRTWLYRVAVRHVLDYRRSSAESAVAGFECFATYLEAAPSSDVDPSSPEWELLVAEARSMCTMGMLLCFDRDQRVVFLLGELLGLSDSVAAAVLETSRDNFRQKLARARGQLEAFMHARCGLMNPANPCRCSRKTAAFVRDGIVDPQRLQFAEAHVARVRTQAPARARDLNALQQRELEHLRDAYPLLDPPGVALEVARFLATTEVRRSLDLGEVES